MRIVDLIGKGYFPKELPPPFQTEKLAGKLTHVEKEWAKVVAANGRESKVKKDTFKEKFRESKWVLHSIPKVGFSRRLLGIPNPYHQVIVSNTIYRNWTAIEAIYEKSKISKSKPVLDKSGKRAVKTIRNFGEFKKDRLINSFDKFYEVRTDVSRYYPTIYTHIIPWIIHTKAVAKANRQDLSFLGNLLDKNLREGNSGQTFGIPIGPDTSLIVAEIIGCTLDEVVQKKFPGAKSFRYIDDYYIYCKSYATAEKIFKFLQGLLTEYQLDINEEKTKITRCPFPFEAAWAIEMGSFIFRETKIKQQTDLERFISLAFHHAQHFPKDSVLKYAIACIRNIKLFDESWELYQSIILKIALTDPGTLPDVAQILVTHKKKVSVNKVKSIVESIITEHSPKGHHFEISWALWICRELGFKLKTRIAQLVFDSNDVISILIALDLKQRGQIHRSVSLTNIETEINADSLMSERWLLCYEAVKKGWVGFSGHNPIHENEYFKILDKLNIEFYESGKSITPLSLSPTLPITNPISQPVSDGIAATSTDLEYDDGSDKNLNLTKSTDSSSSY